MANKSDNIIEEEARAIEVGEETGGTPQQRRQRDSWASRTGFILACVGSAVGMANIWLFPYRASLSSAVRRFSFPISSSWRCLGSRA